ncbi:helix-turn-helix domain-containing protein [Paucibacter sp. KBW04]|uniref:helix-turn-helix domain-containing protein n=1 Tax=Paucibacter sp. KBW04 TaxID=2153361 RepID=UPI000F58B8EA|nr:helix-turn-helix domain-containing protein [Paucibacter sp. KBW04]
MHALEASSGWTPQARFASAVTHVIHGHLPYARYHAAGRVRIKSRSGVGVIERLVQDWLTSDLNPAVQIFRSHSQTANALRCYNAYNASANLAIRTTAASQVPSGGSKPIIQRRELLSTRDDPEPCRLGSMLVLQTVMDIVARNENGISTPRILSLPDLAIHLGVARSASAEVAVVFDAEGYVPVGEAARLIGCHQRTMERRLREEGLTAEAIRTATRLIRATKRIRSSDSLTTIALEEGFSDQAQMSRAFRLSSGMTPSLLRAIS